jgi:hypothetical protein
MSMNVHIFASRSVICEKTGERDTQEQHFDCWQTPTSDSYAIYGKPDRPEEERIEAYREWVRNQPIPKKYSTEHLEELDAWVKFYTARGYSIHLVVW